MHNSAPMALLAAIVAPFVVLSAPGPGRGGYAGYHGRYDAGSSSTTTTRLSANPELASRILEYIARQSTRSPSSCSTESPSPTSRVSSCVDSETTTTGTSTILAVVATPRSGSRENSTKTTEDGLIVVPTMKRNSTIY